MRADRPIHVSTPSLLRGLAALLLLSAGCASPIPREEQDDLRRHVVSSDEEGMAIDPVDGSELGNFTHYVETILEHAAQEADQHPPPDGSKVRRLLIHVHGGLNSDDASRRAAASRLAEIDREPGADWSYPIFLTWPSGGLDSVQEHLVRLRFGSHLPAWLGWPASVIVLPFDLVQGLARSPQTVLSMFATDIEVGLGIGFGVNVMPSWARAKDVYAAIRAAPPSPAGRDAQVHLGEFTRSAGLHVWRFSRYLVLFPVKMVTTPLFVDGIGREAWRVMLHRASNTLRPTTEFEDELFDGGRREPVSALRKPATGAFARFFDALEARIAKDRELHPEASWEITLIGHSMGTIILNDALQLFPTLPVRNIVYMAAACSVGEAEEALVPYLAAHEGTRFYNLTLHPLAEAGEVAGYDLPSRGSLLEWIDQWFESPDHPLDRRLGKWNNAIDSLHVFERVRARVTLKGFGVRDNSKPSQHGEFNECPFWRAEFWSVDGPDVY